MLLLCYVMTIIFSLLCDDGYGQPLGNTSAGSLAEVREMYKSHRLYRVFEATPVPVQPNERVCRPHMHQLLLLLLVLPLPPPPPLLLLLLRSTTRPCGAVHLILHRLLVVRAYCLAVVIVVILVQRYCYC
jgi:hypothetical protein